MKINNLSLILLASSLISILYSFIVRYCILKNDKGDKKVQEIAEFIRKGSQAFFKRQYTSIFLASAAIFLLIYFLISKNMSYGFIIGVFGSSICGYIGMNISTRANSITAVAAKRGLSSAFDIAFKAGVSASFFLNAIVIGTTVSLLIWSSTLTHDYKVYDLFIGLGFGASLVSVFARLGGGIFTKGADVGADLSGKVYSDIPEDDPRNPAVIADVIGDNVGDCAGVSADIFQTYIMSLISAILIGYMSFDQSKFEHIVYTISIAGASIVPSMFVNQFININRTANILGAMTKGLIMSTVLSFITSVIITKLHIGCLKSSLVINESQTVSAIAILSSVLIGLISSLMVFAITYYYTSSSKRPVIDIARASESGAGTNIIQGVSVGLESVVIPGFIIILTALSSYIIGGYYCVAISSVAMMAICPTIMSIDIYGPICDNAGGIAELSKMGDEVRVTTDILDSVGNTTKAVTKGYCIGSSVLASIVMFDFYFKTGAERLAGVALSIDNIYIISGIISGGMIIYYFASSSMLAVSDVAKKVVENVKEQFESNPKILEGKMSPDYEKTADMLTSSSIKKMIPMTVISILALFLSYYIPFLLLGKVIGFQFLSGTIVGVVVSGFLLSNFMTTSGGAWDNAKKYIEETGEKNSDTHKASVVGDTVGDPFKDTTGTAINPMMKTLVIVSIIILRVFL